MRAKSHPDGASDGAERPALLHLTRPRYPGGGSRRTVATEILQRAPVDTDQQRLLDQCEMARLRVFVSSTCFDLGSVRAQLRRFIESLGYEAVLSDFGDVTYDPRVHTHTSCVSEVENAQLLVLIIGGRFGGPAVEEAKHMAASADVLDELTKTRSDWTSDGSAAVSITQLEVICAVKCNIPVYVLVDRHVMGDHHVYQKNKAKGLGIEYPSIQNNKYAPHIFEFINYLKRRPTNNSISEFLTSQDIEDYLRKQWGGYFQRLLVEQRNSLAEQQSFMTIGQRLDDLQAAILSAVTDDKKGVAAAVVEHRKVLQLAASIARDSLVRFAEAGVPWDTVVKHSVIAAKSIVASYTQRGAVDRMVLQHKDGTFWRAKFNMQGWQEFRDMWANFLNVDAATRKAAAESVLNEFSEDRRLLHKDPKQLAEVFSEDELE